MKKVSILHGWSYSTDKWGNFAELIKAGDITPVLIKIPGLTEKTDKVWSLDDYVEWLKKTLGNEKAILIGHSNGGRIALAFAAKYPEKLKQLILIDSAGLGHNEIPLRIKRLFFGTVAKLGKKITSSEKLKTLLYKLVGESDYKNATQKMRQTMVNLISVDLTSKLSKIAVPTLIIWGKKDKTTPLKEGNRMHKLIKNSKLIIIENAKHSPQFTHPNEVAEKVLAEIEKL